MPQAMSESIAFAIAGSIVTRDTNQKHIALIYRANNFKVMLLHLGWHHQLCHHEWDEKYHWLEFNGLDRELQETFADWAVMVANASPGTPIPYSVIFRPDKNFDQNGHFINLNDGSGLTCATFLLALFNDYNLPLINISDWPESRENDLKWLRKILKMLRNTVVKSENMPKWEWLEQFRHRHRLKRFRPEEVFATAELFSGEPLSFSVLEKAGCKINSIIPS